MKYKLHKHSSLQFNSLLNFHPGTVCVWLSCILHCKLATYHNRDQIIETGQNTQGVQKQHVSILTTRQTSAATWSIYRPVHLYIYCGSLLTIPLWAIICFCEFVSFWVYKETVKHELCFAKLCNAVLSLNQWLAFQLYWLSLCISASGKVLLYSRHKECVWVLFSC